MELQKTRTLKDRILLFLKGLAMGAANKVPGVSGGIVAFVTGFYEELIYSFNKINYKSFKLLLSGRFKSFFRYTNAHFLVIVFSGSVFSYFTVSLLLDYLLKHYELYVWSLFFGLILGSIYYIAQNFKDYNPKCNWYILIGIALGAAISFLPPAKENDNLWFIFLCGMIGVSGMTLPGLSGSFILILLGNYVLLLVDSVNALSKTLLSVIKGDFSFLNDPDRIRYLKIIGVFTAGSAFGLVVTSHILEYVLKRWHNIVTAIILGFITGSLGNVWPWKEKIYLTQNKQLILDSSGTPILINFKRYFPDLTSTDTWVSILLILIGFFLLVWISAQSKKNKISKNV
jgi:uncharacterized membrane protein